PAGTGRAGARGSGCRNSPGPSDASGVRHGHVARHSRLARSQFTVHDGSDRRELDRRVGPSDPAVLGSQHPVAAGEVVARVVVERADDGELARDLLRSTAMLGEPDALASRLTVPPNLDAWKFLSPVTQGLGST